MCLKVVLRDFVEQFVCWGGFVLFSLVPQQWTWRLTCPCIDKEDHRICVKSLILLSISFLLCCNIKKKNSISDLNFINSSLLNLYYVEACTDLLFCRLHSVIFPYEGAFFLLTGCKASYNSLKITAFAYRNRIVKSTQ